MSLHDIESPILLSGNIYVENLHVNMHCLSFMKLTGFLSHTTSMDNKKEIIYHNDG